MGYELSICDLAIFGEELQVYPRVEESLLEAEYDVTIGEELKIIVAHITTNLSDYQVRLEQSSSPLEFISILNTPTEAEVTIYTTDSSLSGQ